MKNQLKLRPHHGMCIAFFKGKGYSDEFTSHMAETIRTLKKDPMITLTADIDHICQHCPNNENGVCRTAEKVAKYDKEVLSRCGFQNGDTIRYSELKNAVYDKIFLANTREDICGDCEWSDICHFEPDETAEREQ